MNKHTTKRHAGLLAAGGARVSQDAEAIKRAADIVGFVGVYVKLRKAGAEFVGLCPFHKEKTPSFCVHPGKQVYHCHGCAAGGDVIKFAMGIEHIAFPEALQLLADRYGVAIGAKPTREQNRNWRKTAKERELVEHFRLVEGVPIDDAAIEYARQNRKYKAWLKRDLANAHAVTAALIAMLAIAQQRDGDFPKVAA